MRILASICARGGSKGVKDKNIRDLCGHPLIAYTIDIMKQWSKADRIVVSTDSDRIADIAKQYGAEVPFMRPAHLATDDAPKIPVLQQMVEYCEQQQGGKFDIIIDLQPTSPLRTTKDLDGILKDFMEVETDVIYSVTESKKNPYFTMVELDNNGYACLSKQLEEEVFRRQDVPKVYSLNGSMYVFNRDFLMSTDSLHCEKERIYVMDEITSIDIDTELDFKFIEFILKSKYFEYSFS